MSDTSDPEIPSRPPAFTPGRPLPRISRTAPLTQAEAEKEAEEAEGSKPPKPKPKKKKGKVDADGNEKKGVLIEETPTLDTYASRKAVRIGVGAAAVVALGLAILIVARAFRAEEPEPPPAGPEVTAPARPPGNAEAEARVLLADAREFAKQKKEQQAEERLHKVLASYPKTKAASDAQESLSRRKRGLPYFPGGPEVAAVHADPPPEPPKPVVEAVPAEPPKPVVAEVKLQPPPQPPEPRRETGLTLPTAEVAPRPLPRGFRARPEAGVHPSGWPLEITCDTDGGAMVLIPAGTFTMGRDDGPAAERPAHKVALSAYYIDQHEITNRQYAIFLEKTDPHQRPPAASAGAAPPNDDRPVVNVSFHEAAAYAQWAGKRLPTEAQWEMAGRTIDGRLHPWGAGPADWSKPRAPRQIDPVMSFPLDLSPYGAFDLAGNAWEWTADVFDPNAFRKRRGTTAINPVGPDRAASRTQPRTVKGCSKTWELSAREGFRPDVRFPYLGFRCALVVDDAPPPVAPAGPNAPATPNPPANPSGAVPF
jgi:formylglycine-generating enzyme